jgi:peptidyl-prolyl cis-trans isomerase SurA
MKFKFFIILFFFIISKNLNVKALENKILFKVNNEIITTIDISNEINYLQTINVQTNNLEQDIIIDIAKNSLIREKIKKIEMLKNIKELKIGEEYLNLLIKNIFSNLGFENEVEFNIYLESKNVTKKRLKEKITIDASWKQFIYQKFKNKIKIDKEKIKTEVSNKKSISFNISEILFNLEKNENLNEKFKIIIETINQNGFENAALIYSLSDTSKNGGKIGWINESTVSKKIAKELSLINIHEFTKPIKVPSGFLILKLNDIKKEKAEINLEEETNRIANIKINEQLNQFSNIYLKKIRKNIIINAL